MTRPTFNLFGPLLAGTTVVEASAGTGKTYSLTLIAARLVAEAGLPIEDILLVTFTRAATAELRERVRSRLATTAKGLDRVLAGAPAPDDLKDPLILHLAFEGSTPGAPHPDAATHLRRLRRAVRGVDAAPITTIHGFCQRVLSEHAFESGTDLTAEPITDATPLLHRVADDLEARTFHDADDTEALFLREGVRTRTHHLRDLVTRVAGAQDHRIEPEPGPVEAWFDAVHTFRELWRAEHEDAYRVLDSARTSRKIDGRKYSSRWVPDAFDKLAAWVEGPPTPPPVSLGWVTRLYASRIHEASKDGGDAGFHPLFVAWEQLSEDGRRATDGPRAAIAHQLRADVSRVLREQAVLTFDQLLHGVRARSKDPQLIAALRARYRAALIDEFQDTDGVQWDVFRDVFVEDPSCYVFLVGDPKQAIYAFRGADIHVYGQAVRWVETRAPDRVTTLTRNFRSDKPLIDALNHLFATGPDAFEADFIRYVCVDVPSHRAASRLQGPHPRPALGLRWLTPSTLGCPDAEPQASLFSAYMPALVADEAAALLADGTTFDDAALRPKHLAVLVRSHRTAGAIQAELLRRGIPAVVRATAPVTHSTAATLLLDWLDAVSDPANASHARKLAIGPLLGWTAAELLRATEPSCDADAPWVARWAGVRDQLRSLNTRLHRSGFLAVWNGFLRDPDVGCLGRLAAQPEGERLLTDLAHLAELLQAQVRAGQVSVDGLSAWLRDRQAMDDLDRDEVAQRLASEADAVQVLTLHASKGLQFPVVLLPELAVQPTLRPDDVRTLRFRDDQGPGLDLSADKDLEPKASRVAEATEEAWREAMRLTYVGLTRAESHLIVWCPTVKHLASTPIGSLLAGHAPGAHAAGPRHIPASEASPDDVYTWAQAAAACPHIGLSEPDLPGSVANPALTHHDPTLQTRTSGRTELREPWRRLSFSSLVRNLAHHNPPPGTVERQDDDTATEGTEAPPHRQPAEVPLAGFPRGAQPGTYLHEVLEHLDFPTLTPTLPGAVTLADLLLSLGRRRGITRPDALATLQAELPAVLATPLGGELGSFSLDQLPQTERLDELDFDLPVCGGDAWTPKRGGLTGAQLAEALTGSHPAPDFTAWLNTLRTIQPQRVAGFLTGSIDLVFRAGGRYFLADYKSNHLSLSTPDGRRALPAAYAPDSLRLALAGSHYWLQLHLYTLALHRYLRHRVPDYHYDTHVGGAYYLFLRGMTGEADQGVFLHRPPRSVVEALDALFLGSEA